MPAQTLRRFWTMLGHVQGQLFNASQLGVPLDGAAHTTVARYLELLVETLLVRRLEPFLASVGKRLVMVIEHRGRRTGVEIKFSSTPKPSRGFWQAIDDLELERALVLAPVLRRYPLSEKVDVLSVWEVAQALPSICRCTGGVGPQPTVTFLKNAVPAVMTLTPAPANRPTQPGQPPAAGTSQRPSC